MKRGLLLATFVISLMFILSLQGVSATNFEDVFLDLKSWTANDHKDQWHITETTSAEVNQWTDWVGDGPTGTENKVNSDDEAFKVKARLRDPHDVIPNAVLHLESDTADDHENKWHITETVNAYSGYWTGYVGDGPRGTENKVNSDDQAFKIRAKIVDTTGALDDCVLHLESWTANDHKDQWHITETTSAEVNQWTDWVGDGDPSGIPGDTKNRVDSDDEAFKMRMKLGCGYEGGGGDIDTPIWLGHSGGHLRSYNPNWDVSTLPGDKGGDLKAVLYHSGSFGERLWLGYGGGRLRSYDLDDSNAGPNQDGFRDHGDKGGEIRDIAVYNDKLWIGYYNTPSSFASTLSSFDPDTGNYETIKTWDSKEIYDIAVYDNKIWAGLGKSSDGYLFYYDVSTGEKDTIQEWKDIKSIAVYDDKIWTGHEGGYLLSYNPFDETWKYHGDSGGAIVEIVVYGGKLWLGGWGGTLHYYDPDTETYFHFNDEDQHILSMTIYDDKIWVGFSEGYLRSVDNPDNPSKTLTDRGSYVQDILAMTTVGLTCGNGEREGGETCDDGNNYRGDGCSTSCQEEPGWSCMGEPSVCTGSLILNVTFDSASIRGNDIEDHSEYQNNLTKESGVNCGVEGVSGRACEFDGMPGNYIEINSMDDFFEGSLGFYNRELTISAWVKPYSLPSGLGRMIVSTYKWSNQGANKRGWTFGDQWGSDNHLQLVLFDGDGTVSSLPYSGFFSNNLNKWAHVVGVYKSRSDAGTFMKLYVNGVEAVSPKTTGVIDEIAYDDGIPLRIGHRADTEEQGMWHGLIDEVKIYNYALTEENIGDLFNEHAEAIGEEPVWQPEACTETDDGTVFVAGTVTKDDVAYPDECTPDNKGVIEKTCNWDGTLSSVEYPCPGGGECSENDNGEGACGFPEGGMFCQADDTAGLPKATTKSRAESSAGNLYYCSLNLGWEEVLPEGDSCIGDHQCESNSCLEGQCYRVRTAIQEQAGILNKIFCILTNFVSYLEEDYGYYIPITGEGEGYCLCLGEAEVTDDDKCGE